ncbi:histone family protein [Candidatus Woesearchaeota archaeon]|nr:histone family protein [Candidatus Woesearchaeota archaeon]
MARKTFTIPRAPVARILYDAGAKRVSLDAVEEFAQVLTDIGEQIATQANKIARHAGRKTIHEGDIKLSAKH